MSGILHCVYTCPRDTDKTLAFLDSHRGLRQLARRQVLVLGADAGDLDNQQEAWVLDSPDYYELLPLKTYAMLQRAVGEPAWDYLLKTDVDCTVDHRAVAQAVEDGVDYAGRVIGIGERCNTRWHFGKCRWKVYESPCPRSLYPDPSSGYASGAAYLLHRRAVEAVVERGVYFAMQHVYEDVMVGKALESRFRARDYRLWSW